MDIHNAIMNIHNSITDIYNCIMETRNYTLKLLHFQLSPVMQLWIKMVINKRIVIGIALSTRNSPYEFNAPIVFWLKLQVKSML